MGWMDDFRNYLASEEGRRAAIQFGINLMQPIQPGQNWASHLGQAIGSVGEAEARAREQQLKDELLRRKLEGYDADREFRRRSLDMKEKGMEALEKYRQQQLDISRKRLALSEKLKKSARGMTREDFIAKNYKNFVDVTGEILPDAVDRAAEVWDRIHSGTSQKKQQQPQTPPVGAAKPSAAAPAAKPNQAAIEHLLKTANDPASIAAFNKVFGPGAAERILKEYGSGGGW